MNRDIFVGVDVGTTGEKVVFLNSKGNILASESIEYSIKSPVEGFAEQDPSKWWEGLSRATRKIIEGNPEFKSDITCLGISGQMHTQVYLDENGDILRNAITWMDQRSKEIVEEINSSQANRKTISDHTYNFLTTTYSAPNILWVKRNQPEIYQDTKKILLAKDFLKYKLSGDFSTDFSDAVGTLLFDTKNKKWSPELFELFGLKRSLMPHVGKSGEIVGEITSEAEEKTGLPAGTPIINGSADHAATSLGAGVTTQGEVTAIVGTAGVVSVLADEPVKDPDERVFCWNYCLEDKWVNLAPMQTAGKALDWFKRTFDSSRENPFKEYNKNIKEVPDGSGGLIFLPYLMGERSPIWDPDARGVFFGISNNHGKYHFVKSIMEGVSYAFRQNAEVIESLGVDIDQLKFLGGGSNSEEWIKIMAKVLGKKIRPVQGSDLGAIGTSILSGVSTGVFQDIPGAVNNLTKTGEFYEYEDGPEIYRENYEKFQDIYKQLSGLFNS